MFVGTFFIQTTEHRKCDVRKGIYLYTENICIEQPTKSAYFRSLIINFNARLQDVWILYNISMKTEGPDQIARMRNLIRVFTIRRYVLQALPGMHRLISVFDVCIWPRVPYQDAQAGPGLSVSVYGLRTLTGIRMLIWTFLFAFDQRTLVP